MTEAEKKVSKEITGVKFRKKPEVVEAWLWDETRTTFDKIGCTMMSYSGHAEFKDRMTNLIIDTQNGSECVNFGDYIIKDSKGEFYSCKYDTFLSMYEEI